MAVGTYDSSSQRYKPGCNTQSEASSGRGVLVAFSAVVDGSLLNTVMAAARSLQQDRLAAAISTAADSFQADIPVLSPIDVVLTAPVIKNVGNTAVDAGGKDSGVDVSVIILVVTAVALVLGIVALVLVRACKRKYVPLEEEASSQAGELHENGML